MFTESNFHKQANGFTSYKIVDKPSGGGDPELHGGANLQNIRNLSEFQTAFFWCEKLRQKVNPADHSIDSIRLFLLENDHFALPLNADGLGRNTVGQGSFCAQFTDYVIKINNVRFSQRNGYLIYAPTYLIFTKYLREYLGNNISIIFSSRNIYVIIL